MKQIIERLERNLSDPQKTRGFSAEVIVNARDLHELLEDYKVMDSRMRAELNTFAPTDQRLHEAIIAVWYSETKDSEQTLAIIMETLADLIEKKRKEKIPLGFKY